MHERTADTLISSNGSATSADSTETTRNIPQLSTSPSTLKLNLSTERI